MRLFIANDVLQDYTYGMIVVAAPSEDAILEVISNSELGKIGTYDEQEHGISNAVPEEVRGTYIDHGEVNGPARLIAYCWGGA